MSRFKWLRAIFKDKGHYGKGPKVWCAHCDKHEWTTIRLIKGNIKLRCQECKK